MLIAYKLWYVKRDDDDIITEVAVRFYEGLMVTEPKFDITKREILPCTYFKRKRLQRIETPFLSGEYVKDSEGLDCKLYSQKDFGKIKLNSELKLFLDKELAKDLTRSLIL